MTALWTQKGILGWALIVTSVYSMRQIDFRDALRPLLILCSDTFGSARFLSAIQLNHSTLEIH